MLQSNFLTLHSNIQRRNVYMYRNKIPIPALAMVDDIAMIALCNSADALTANVKTDTFIQRKKLEGQTGAGKCQWVHVGGGSCNSCYSINGHNITKADTYKYMGDHVSDGWNPLYQKRCEKAQGYSAICQAMSTEISLGIRLFEMAKLFHQAIFVNGSLLNVETWPNCTESRMIKFERIEQRFLRSILNAHSKTPIEALYLELGIVPLRFHLMKRRILYLHDIVNRDDEELVKKIVLAQKERSCSGDFYEQVLENMRLLDLNFEMLMANSKAKVKADVGVSIEEKAYQYLIGLANTHSKTQEMLYQSCNGSEYFRDPKFTPELANLLFKFRTRTYMVKNNFRNNYKNTNILCPLCEISNDTQQHIMKCHKIVKTYQHEIQSKYDDIYSKNLETLLAVAMTLHDLTEIRKELLTRQTDVQQSEG